MNEKEVKGISLFKTTYFLSSVVTVIFVFLVFILFMVHHRFTEVNKAMQTFIVSNSSSTAIKNAAHELTDYARLFIISGKTEYARKYIDTKFNKRTAERAFEQLKTVYNESETTYQRLEVALKQSEDLANLELYAIALMYESRKEKFSDTIPIQIRNTRLRKIDQELTSKQLKNKAKDAVFGDGYLIYKQRIDENCDIIIQDIQKGIQDHLKISSDQLGTELTRLSILEFLAFASCITLVLFLVKLVFAPLSHFINAIKYDLELEEVGSREFKILAEVYNDSYQLKKRTEKQLLIDSEQDALTGIRNRRAFEEICSRSEEDKERVAILLIDLDDFKHVNDTYGHKSGDAALKALARALTSVFRRDDFVCRIGGDEFAVVLKDFNPEAEIIIYSKISQVSDLIQTVDDQFGITISVGAAISDNGYSTELFQNADKALYKVKLNGKNGCEIYHEGDPSFSKTAITENNNDDDDVEELMEFTE